MLSLTSQSKNMFNNYVLKIFNHLKDGKKDHAEKKMTIRKAGYFSLQKKGLFFISFLSIYAALVAYYLMHEKNILLSQFTEYRTTQKTESILNDANLALNNTYIHLLLESRNGRAIDRNSPLHEDFIRLEEQYSSLLQSFPEQAQYYKQIVQLLASLVNVYSSENEKLLLNILDNSQKRLGLLLTRNKAKRQQLFDHYHELSNSVALASLVMGLVGVATFGVLVIWFFTHMAKDIFLLQDRVKKIIQGEWGKPVSLGRQDELGQLNSGINEMSQRLASSEKALEIERRKYFDHQKNCALAHFAAGLIHEIGNPVSAITAMTDMLQDNSQRTDADIDAYLGQVSEYSQRMISIVQDMSRLATPPDNDFGLIEINSLISDVCGMIHYDERWFSIDINLALANGLPAVNGVHEQLRQVFLNILSNAYDALQSERQHEKKIQISTSFDRVEHQLLILIRDNGCGMSPAVLEKAFDPMFTTKAIQHGAGLGLSLCRAIIDNHSGDICIKSAENQGTEIRILLPSYQE